MDSIRIKEKVLRKTGRNSPWHLRKDYHDSIYKLPLPILFYRSPVLPRNKRTTSSAVFIFSSQIFWQSMRNLILSWLQDSVTFHIQVPQSWFLFWLNSLPFSKVMIQSVPLYSTRTNSLRVILFHAYSHHYILIWLLWQSNWSLCFHLFLFNVLVTTTKLISADFVISSYSWVFGNIWRGFWLSQLGVCYWNLVGRDLEWC